MDSIWAPWRMDFIEGKTQRETGCVFCNRVAMERGRWREYGILDVGGDSMVLMNRYPYTNGHLLIIPRRHVSDLMELSTDEYVHLSHVLRASVDRLRDAMGPQGFNIGMNLGAAAGAGIADHAHFHIVPRWNGDHNFMPVIGNVRVMPEYLAATYDKLAPHFAGLCGQ
ncbi:HIT domain-containing protein [Myxococcota bacterium]|jgi:ATP adenylyltransferase|nr:HIT domain-containing protein [Myxococcota bacterium]MBU1412584.1 HIT domain-containing protein [Myxococcota bacterium]MBU1512086.1 HIT domain-containing protein [Myxococcota bacterium]PKN17897.1 MAG: HIT family hydrolase [Deltaproteobacteria bacterium HGW-Deltaproteobacteria-22]